MVKSLRNTKTTLFFSREKSWDKLILLILIILIGTMLALLSVQVYIGYNDGMNDIGNMAQSIWSATQGRSLEFTFHNGQLSRLGLHVELIYYLISPLYSIFPQPTTLLVLQSVLFVLGAIPVFSLASRKLKAPLLALSFVIIYLFYPVAQTAVLFDFHGDTLAMPLLLFGLNSFEEKRWKSYIFFIALALSCKFYIAVPVITMGFVILFKLGRQSAVIRKIGLYTILSGLIWGLLAFFVIRPSFAPDTGVNLASAASPIGYLLYYFGEIANNISASMIPRLGTILLLFVPTIWLSVYSSIWLLPAAVSAIPAVLSNGVQYTYYFHHYALAVPFIIFAAILGAVKLKGGWKTSNKLLLFSNPQKMILLSLLMTLVFNVTLVDTPMNPSFWSGQPNKGLDSLRYGRLPRDGVKDALLKKYVQPGESVAVSWALAPHLTNRQTLFVLDYFDTSSLDFDMAIADGLFDYAVAVPGGFTGGVLHDVPYIRALLQRPDLSLVNIQDGLLFFELGHQAENLLESVKTEPFARPIEFTHVFNGSIGLVNCSVEEIRAGVYQFNFIWKLTQPVYNNGPLFAISQLVDPSNLNETTNMRILHIPTEIILPTSEWKLDELVIETFDVRLPYNLEAGNYKISTSWYTGNNIYSFLTDSRSQFGDQWTWGNISIP